MAGVICDRRVAARGNERKPLEDSSETSYVTSMAGADKKTGNGA